MPSLNILILRGLASWGGMVLFLAIEAVRPYRRPSVPRMQRLATNISLTILNGVVLNLLFASATINTAIFVTEQKIGLLNLTGLPFPARVFLSVLFMDLMLYIWHFLNHEMPLFWRFHRVHHSDLNMDVSTATRFHIGELAISSLIKICLIYFIGADIVSVVLFETLLVLSAQFQHSSLKVSDRFERIFWLFFVPPSMHRIHHSVVIRERNTNYGTILSIWDRMLGTLLKGIDQESIVIGMGSYRDPAELKLRHLLWMPFTREVR